MEPPCKMILETGFVKKEVYGLEQTCRPVAPMTTTVRGAIFAGIEDLIEYAGT